MIVGEQQDANEFYIGLINAILQRSPERYKQSRRVDKKGNWFFVCLFALYQPQKTTSPSTLYRNCIDR